MIFKILVLILSLASAGFSATKPSDLKCNTDAKCLTGKAKNAYNIWPCFEGYNMSSLCCDDGNRCTRDRCSNGEENSLVSGCHHSSIKRCQKSFCKPGTEVIMTMDDLPPIQSYAPIGNQYKGIFLSQTAFYLNSSYYSNSGYYNAVTSAPNVMYGEPLTFSVPGGSFALKSINATAAHNDGLFVNFKGFLNGTQVAEFNTTLVTTAPIYLPINFAKVDQVRVVSSGGILNPNLDSQGTRFAFDDLVFCNIVQTQPLPQ